MRSPRLFVATVLAVLAWSAPAGAATPLGQVAAVDPNPCSDINFIQLTISSGTSYVVPAGGGVITQWQSRGRMASPGMGRLQVWRAVTSVGYTLIGRSAVETFTAGSAPLYLTQIPVAAGDILGLRLNATGGCYAPAPSTSDLMALDTAPDPAVGDTLSFITGQQMSRVNVAATLEPDADCDGLGDETQDPSIDPTGCNPPAPPAPPDGGGDATAPDTTITDGPKAKTKSKRASFGFSSTEPGSTFECMLDDGAFQPCTSPFDVKVKRGKHTLAVRAKDAAGNVDPTPAERSWKVKKPRRK